MVGDLRSRVIHLVDGQDRAGARNQRTGVLIGEAAPPPTKFAELFRLAWPDLRRLLLGFAQPGVAIVAVDTVKKRVAGTLGLAAQIGRASAAVVGRHGHADLYLEADPSLALRHLAVIVHPQTAGGEVTYRLLDLRTRTAFSDESGRRLEALTAAGPTFVRVGSYVLYILCTGESGPWPEDAADAWQCVPERVYVEEADAEPDRWQRRRKHGAIPAQANGLAAGTGVVDPWEREGSRASITLVKTSPGPSRARLDRVGDGEIWGTLRLRAGGRSEALTVGQSAARTGVLIGRYERCDTHGATVLAHHGISRVHVLVVEIEGALYAIDTGSTNGVYQASAEVRVARLAPGTELVLGDDLARLEWSTP